MTRALLVVVLMLLYLGCGDDSSQTADEPYVADGSLFDPRGTPARLADKPVLTIGDSDALPLDRVTGAVFLEDQLAIANGGYYQVLILDSVGQVVARQGQRGYGPGEYINLSGLVRHRNDLIAWDAYHGRATLLDRHGAVIHEVSIRGRPFEPIKLIGAFGRSLLLTFEPEGFIGEGAEGPTEFRRRADYEIVSLNDGTVVREISLPGEEQYVQRLGTRLMHGGLPVIFGRRSASATTLRHAFLGVTDSMVLATYDEDGNADRITFNAEAIPVQSEWEGMVRDSIRAHVNSIPAELGPNSPFLANVVTFRLTLLETLPARSSLPRFADMKGASDGRLWIREYSDPTQDVALWIVLDDQLEPVEFVHLPVGIRILDISRDRVLVLSKGVYGEHLVQVFQIVR